MLSIFSKLNPISIDAFTYNESIYNYYPPRPSKEYIPTWWKQLSSDFTDSTGFNILHPTMKRCMGFIESFRYGFIVPLWSDLSINLFKDGQKSYYRYQFADAQSILQTHNPEQYKGFIDTSSMQHFKIIVPWRIKEKSGIKFNISQPTWNMCNLNSNLTVLGGISDFKYQDSCHFQILVNYPESNNSTNILIPSDTPLMQVTPLSERPIKIHTHLIDKSKYENSGLGIMKFSGNYLHRQRVIDRAEKSKCPIKNFLKK